MQSYLPFSDGPRSCAGMQLAYLDVRTIVLVSGVKMVVSWHV